MGARRSLGRQFGWLWGAYAVSAYGSGFGLGAFPLIAIRVLHAGPAEVAALTAAGLAVAAVVAVPLGPVDGVPPQAPGDGRVPREPARHGRVPGTCSTGGGTS